MRKKRGGVDLSAFHATQGRRIVTLVIRYARGGVRSTHKIWGFREIFSYRPAGINRIFF
jgi:hypothetical protein